MNSTYEHIVLGVAGIGSAAAYWLARRRGDGILALEQYRPGHDRGVSEDHSRIIRHSYHTSGYNLANPGRNRRAGLPVGFPVLPGGPGLARRHSGEHP